MRRKTISLAALVMTLALSSFHAPAQADLNFLNHNQPMLDAHNCYPYEGQWNDRIQRALNSGFPVQSRTSHGMSIKPPAKAALSSRILLTRQARSLR